MNKFAWLAVSSILLAGAAPAMAGSLVGGDAEAGKGKAAVCAACHGQGGNSTNSAWPKLAGQGAVYTYEQLKAFKDGSRSNPIMAGQVANLSDQDMKDLAAYFATQSVLPGAANEELAPVGEALYRGGDAERGIPACSGCHGPAGAGNAAAAYPGIGGQHADYSAAQLRAYRDGQRNGTAKAKMMSEVANKLTEDDIAAVASYLSGLHE